MNFVYFLSGFFAGIICLLCVLFSISVYNDHITTRARQLLKHEAEKEAKEWSDKK
jgi:hypothetical protein